MRARVIRTCLLGALAILILAIVVEGLGVANRSTRTPSEIRLALTTASHYEVDWATHEPLSGIFAPNDSVTLDNATTLTGTHGTRLLKSDHFPWLVTLTVHRVDLGQLAPASNHSYALPRREAITFRTAAKDELTLVVLGDTGLNEHDRAFATQAANAHPDLILHVGDLAYAFNDESKWEDWMTVIQQASMHAPLETVPGNHEKDFGENYRNYDARFDTRGTHHHSYDLGPAHFVHLDTEDMDASQDAWLANDLAHVDREKTPWVIALLHRPMYSSGILHTSDQAERDHFEKLFNDNHVNLVLTGHEHNYERTHPVTNGAINASGPVYIVTGGGGATLYPDFLKSPAWSATRSATHEMLELHITRTLLHGSALKEDGTALDTFDLTPS